MRFAFKGTAFVLFVIILCLITPSVSSCTEIPPEISHFSRLEKIGAERKLDCPATGISVPQATRTPTPIKRVRTRVSAPAAPKKSRKTTSVSTIQSILNSYIAKYPILEGSTVCYGDAQGYQAICYYKSARIIISPNHIASLDTLIGHEIRHIIDWRDNGVIDWGSAPITF